MSSASLRRAAVCIWAFACSLIEAQPAHAQDEAEEAARPAGRVASASLCADAYVLAVSDPDSLLALSWQVDQPVSAAPDWARSLPQAWPDAERLLRLDPDLTVFGAGEAGRVGAMLDRAGMDWVELAWASDFDGVRTNLRTVGASLDRAAAVEGVLGDMDRRLEALQDRAGQRSGQPRILYLSSSGGSAGSGTYVDAAIRAAGGINVTAEQGGIGWTRSDPEFALTMDADILLTSFFRDGYASTFNRAVHHSAYRHLLEIWPRVDIPSGDWPCAGPRLVDAAERIANAIDVWEASR